MAEIRERRIAPWVWVLIVLLALILIFVVWWVVAAQSPSNVVVVPGPSQPTTTPQTPTAPPSQPSPPAQPATPSGGTQPVVVQPQPPVNIYINTKGATPEVYVVPKGQQPPSSSNAQQVNLPGAFKYQGKTWTASDTAVTSATAKLKEIGVSVRGKPLYADQNAKPPYDTLYIETSPGSGVFLEYDHS